MVNYVLVNVVQFLILKRIFDFEFEFEFYFMEPPIQS
jgi:hypothetical protein